MKERAHRGVFARIIIFSSLCIIAIGGFALFNYYSNSGEFYRNTTINGVAVGGMNVVEASNVLQAQFVSNLDDIKVGLTYEGKKWEFVAGDFESVDDFVPLVQNAYNDISSTNILERRMKIKELKKNNGQINISYRKMLGGFDEKLDMVSNEVYRELVEPSVAFDPNLKKVFSYKEGQDEVVVDRERLIDLIDGAFLRSKNISVEIPVVVTKPKISIDELKAKTKLRSKFSTSYSSSTADRKSNVRTALGAFNGQIIMPDQEVSFNETTGARTKENGYKPANIILNGIYVEGSGGGVCQASTTLYNALLLANVEILEVNKHSMPASYVPLALDAMVSEGISDLKFKNTTGEPLYIKTWGDNSSAYVEIYGLPFENGEYYKTRSEFVKSLPHRGDRIIVDDGTYSNKVTFKGEYLRIKYPKEGYEANAYLQHFNSNGELIDEVLIRHEIYSAQEGIIVEGTEEVYDGISLPENDVKFIPPQVTSNTNKDNVTGKIKGNDNEKYNP